MGQIESRWRDGVTRRQALKRLAGMLAGSPLLGMQRDPRPLKDHRRLPGMREMMTAFDFEPIFFANVPLAAYDYTAHGTDSEFTLQRNRDAFDWVELVEGRDIAEFYRYVDRGARHQNGLSDHDRAEFGARRSPSRR